MNKPDGGPAFPHTQWEGSAGDYQPVISGGMSLRDYYIAHAPVSEIEILIPDAVGDIAKWVGHGTYVREKSLPAAYAKARGIWADAMLAECGK